MPSRNLPSFTAAEVEKHNTEGSCYVTVGNIVYDVTDFLESHPGGPGLILDYGGKDITDILADEISHRHSQTAYDVLEDSIVGYLGSGKNAGANGMSSGVESPGSDGEKPVVHPRTGMSCAEDLSKDTDISTDFRTHKFLDLNRPLLMQVWRGGFSKDFYLDQVHRPRHYKGGASAPLFGNFLEPLSMTPWWMIPTIWVPFVAYLVYIANVGFTSTGYQVAYFGLGLFAWTLIEYLMHRFFFHLDYYLPDNRVFITLHFLLHGVHHYLPMDRYRLVMPPTLFGALALPFWRLAHCILFHDWYAATTAFAGGVFGYIGYDLTHYFLHHENLPLWYKDLKKHHLAHHFLDYELGFGVSSRFWDIIFRTELPLTPQIAKAK